MFSYAYCIMLESDVAKVLIYPGLLQYFVDFNQIYPFSAPPFFIVNFLPLSFRISIKVIIFASVLQNQKQFYEDHRG